MKRITTLVAIVLALVGCGAVAERSSRRNSLG